MLYARKLQAESLADNVCNKTLAASSYQLWLCSGTLFRPTHDSHIISISDLCSVTNSRESSITEQS